MNCSKRMLLTGLLWLFAVQNTMTQGLVFTTNTLTVGNSPNSVCAADFYGNGKVDLISANQNVPGSLTVLTNNGSGFGFNATLNVGTQPGSVISTDVNGDGKPDLIIARATTLTVLTNNGSGGFGSNNTYAVDGYTGWVTAADINGDGKVDLISANHYQLSIAPGNTLTVLTNNGNGIFSYNATLATGAGVQCVVAADINGDGKPDLVSANYYPAGTLTVLTNDGYGVFGSNATLTVNGLPYFVAAADINGDGKPDLITATIGGYNNNNLTVLTNNGSAGFGFNAVLPLPDGSNPYCVVAADVNGDGKMDLISANQGNNTLTVFTNNGSGVFGFNTTLTVGSGPQFILAADLNGDGKPDLVSANTGSGSGNTLTVLVNQTAFPTPTLSITSTNPNLIVSWSSPLTGLVLQTNSDLTTTNWMPSSYPISTNGLVKSIAITLPPQNLFFRLKQ